VTGSALAIFNYQKSSSSVVASTLYSLRVHPTAREILGDEIQFKHHFPIIWGEMNQLHGHIDIQYAVKGTKGDGMMRFKSTRKSRMGLV
jgi:cytochrome c oxidase assembly factor 1